LFFTNITYDIEPLELILEINLVVVDVSLNASVECMYVALGRPANIIASIICHDRQEMVIHTCNAVFIFHSSFQGPSSATEDMRWVEIMGNGKWTTHFIEKFQVKVGSTRYACIACRPLQLSFGGNITHHSFFLSSPHVFKRGYDW
jgi:hypothetical protein